MIKGMISFDQLEKSFSQLFEYTYPLYKDKLYASKVSEGSVLKQVIFSSGQITYGDYIQLDEIDENERKELVILPKNIESVVNYAKR